MWAFYHAMILGNVTFYLLKRDPMVTEPQKKHANYLLLTLGTLRSERPLGYADFVLGYQRIPIIRTSRG